MLLQLVVDVYHQAEHSMSGSNEYHLDLLIESSPQLDIWDFLIDWIGAITARRRVEGGDNYLITGVVRSVKIVSV